MSSIEWVSDLSVMLAADRLALSIWSDHNPFLKCSDHARWTGVKRFGIRCPARWSFGFALLRIMIISYFGVVNLDLNLAETSCLSFFFQYKSVCIVSSIFPGTLGYFADYSATTVQIWRLVKPGTLSFNLIYQVDIKPHDIRRETQVYCTHIELLWDLNIHEQIRCFARKKLLPSQKIIRNTCTVGRPFIQAIEL